MTFSIATPLNGKLLVASNRKSNVEDKRSPLCSMLSACFRPMFHVTRHYLVTIHIPGGVSGVYVSGVVESH